MGGNRRQATGLVGRDDNILAALEFIFGNPGDPVSGQFVRKVGFDSTILLGMQNRLPLSNNDLKAL